MSATEVLEPTAGAEEANTPTEVPGATDDTASASPEATSETPAESEKPREDKERDGAPAQDAAEVAGVQPPAPPAEAPVVRDPWTFRASGQRIPIQGSYVDAHGWLRIPPDQQPGLRQTLASGHDFRMTGRQREQEWNQKVETAGAVEKARADRAELVAAKLIDAIGNSEWMTLAVSDPREAQYLIRELALEFNKAKLEAPRAPEQPRDAGPRVDPAQQEHAARETLKGYVEELLERPQARLVYDTPEKRQKLEQRLQRRIAAYFALHPEDGALSLHENAVDADFEDELNERLAARQEAEKKRKAEEFNAKRNQPATTVPPVVSTKAPAATPAQSTAPTDREAWRRKQGIS